MAGLLDILKGGQQQAAPQVAPQGGGLGDVLSKLGPAIAMIDPRNQQLGLALMAANEDKARQQQRQQNANQTAKWLQSQGLGQEEASYLASDPAALRSWYGEWKTGNKPSWKMGEIYDEKTGAPVKIMYDEKDPSRYNVIGGVKQPDATASGPKYGMSPVYLQNQDGSVGVGQLTSDGQLAPSKMPDGYQVLSPYERSKQTAQGMTEGKVIGEAASQTGDIQQTADMISKQIDDIKNDPNLPRVIGPIDGRTPNFTAGSNEVQAKIDQLRGNVFLQARQLLKGGGAITDYEGKKAEEAFARLNQAQSEDAFKSALDDFNYYVQAAAKKRMEQAAQGQGKAAPSQPAPNATSTGVKWSIE